MTWLQGVKAKSSVLKSEKRNLGETSKEVDCRVGIDGPGRGLPPSNVNCIGRGLPLSKEKINKKEICPEGVDNHGSGKQNNQKNDQESALGEVENNNSRRSGSNFQNPNF